MANTIEVKVPDIGGHDNVPVIEVLVKAGDTVTKEQSLITLESDKATMEVPSSAAGTVKELKLKVGDEVSEGAVILLLETETDAAAAPAPASLPSPSGRGVGGEGSGEARPAAPVAPSPAPAGHPLPMGEGKAPQAAGVIHTDFERGFIKAEVISFEDLVELGSVHEARAKGKARMEGKDYVMKDGDVVEFRFNV